MPTIGDRKSSHPGTAKERKFTIVLVNENTGTSIELSTRVDKMINYPEELVCITLLGMLDSGWTYSLDVCCGPDMP